MGYRLDTDINVVSENPIPLGIKSTFTSPGIFSVNYTNFNQAKDNIKNLLFTKPGERYHHPTFGCGLLNILFQQMTDELSDQINDIITTSVNFWLPYINIENIDVQLNSDEIIPQHTIKISLTFSLTGTIQTDTIIIYASEDGILRIE